MVKSSSLDGEKSLVWKIPSGRPCAEAAMEAQGSTYRGAEAAMVAELDVSDVGHRYVLL